MIASCRMSKSCHLRTNVDAAMPAPAKPKPTDHRGREREYPQPAS